MTDFSDIERKTDPTVLRPVRIYGFTEDYGSYAQVTRGFAEGFRAHGYTDASLDIVSLETEPSFDEDSVGLPTAPVAILTGPPVAAGRMMQAALHEQRFVMVAPNSNKLPERMMHTVNSVATAILVPSMWAGTVVSNYTTLPVYVVPHGVSQGFRHRPLGASLEALYARDEFRILHLSSSDGQRKGTRELVRGFVLAMKNGELPPLAELRLVLTPAALGAMQDFLVDLTEEGSGEFVSRVTLVGRLGTLGASPEQMSGVYSSVHLVCQPSRGEGFGMVPLEALACGTPIAATGCTGHSQWFHGLEERGARLIHTASPGLIDDMPGAEAPRVLSIDVAAALVRAFRNWHDMKAAALGNAEWIRREWSWQHQLETFIHQIR